MALPIVSYEQVRPLTQEEIGDRVFRNNAKILEKSNAARVDIFVSVVRKDLLIYVGLLA